MKKLIVFFISFLFIFNIFSSEKVVEKKATIELLTGYLQSDSDLKNLTIELQKVKLNQERNEIDSNFNISLSTGNINFSLGKDGSFSVNPKVEVAFPQTSNLKVSLGGTIEISDSSSDDKSGNNDENDLLKDISVNLSVDVLPKADLSKQLDFLQQQRKITVAERNLRKKALEKEKSFYSEYESLLQSISSIVEKKQNYYDDKIDFEKVKAQGYAKTSSTYRRAEMKVLSDEHEIEVNTRKLLNDYKIFYINCGQSIEIDENTELIELIPEDITKSEALNVNSFNPETYTLLENAKWENKINTMQRAQNRLFSLSANGGFTFKNQETKTNTVDVGLDGTYKGVTLGFKTNIPIEKLNEKSPSFTISAKVNPNEFKKTQIDEKIEALSEQQELMEIAAAENEYNLEIQKKEMELADINWETSKINENLSLYEETEKEMLKWYKQGVITESEYLSAKVNHHKAIVDQIKNKFDILVYNIEVKIMFIEDSES